MPARSRALAVAVALFAAACSSSAEDTGPPSTTTPIATSTSVGITTTSSAAPASTSTVVTTTTGSAPIEAIVPAAADGLPPLPDQPVDVAWPTVDWPVGGLPDGVDADAVAELVRQGLAGEHGNIEGILVVVGGELVVEEYAEGYVADAPHLSFSVAKSVTHSLLGVLAGDGLIDVTAPAAIEEWQGDDREQITPDMLVRMSSGLAWDELASYAVTDRPDVVSELQSLEPLAADPDTAWLYSTGSSTILGRLMGDIVGLDEDFDQWADEELFSKLGIDEVEVQFDPAGYPFAGSGTNMSARDFARLGLFWLRDGVWDGERLLPEGWMDYARSPSSTYSAYGAGFWLGWQGPGSFSAEGLNGQNVFVVPDLDLVLVTVSAEPNGDPIDQLGVRIIDEFRS